MGGFLRMLTFDNAVVPFWRIEILTGYESFYLQQLPQIHHQNQHWVVCTVWVSGQVHLHFVQGWFQWSHLTGTSGEKQPTGVKKKLHLKFSKYDWHLFPVYSLELNLCSAKTQTTLAGIKWHRISNWKTIRSLIFLSLLQPYTSFRLLL